MPDVVTTVAYPDVLTELEVAKNGEETIFIVKQAFNYTAVA